MPTSNIYNFPITKPWVYHSLFWVSYYIFGALISFSIHQIYDARFYWQLLTLLPPDMVLVYTNLYLLMPYLLLRKKFVGYTLSVLCCITVISLLNIALHRLYTRMGSPFFVHASDIDGRNFAGQVLNSIYLLGLSAAVKFGKDWMAQQQQLQEHQRQQVATELLVEVAGPDSLPANGEDISSPSWAQHSAPHYLNYRKTSIYGGSSEVQRNIIASTILGL